MSSNIDAPHGFSPVRNVAGTAPQLNPYTVAASTTIYEGELVALNTSGLIVDGNDTDALAGNLIGVAAHYQVASGELLVYDDPEQLYAVQADDNSITNLAGYQHLMFDVVTWSGAQTTLLHSIDELDGSSGLTTVGTDAATLRPLLCVGKVNSADNAIGGTTAESWTQFIVKIAPPCHLNGMGEVGITATFSSVD